MKRVLGKSGIEVSALGMGCWAIGGPWWYVGPDGTEEPSPSGWGQVDDNESIRALHAAFDLGVTLYDTADVYGCGHSEAVLGQAFADRRDKIVIATKFGKRFDEDTKYFFDHQTSPELIVQACEDSLRRLQTDYIDLYQFHWVEFDGDAEMVQDTLEALLQQGKIRSYGWSTDLPDMAAAWKPTPAYAVVQLALHAAHGRQEDVQKMFDVLDRLDVAGLVRSPLAMGILTGKFSANTKLPTDDLRHEWDFSDGAFANLLERLEAVREILTSDGRTLAQGSLAWLWACNERLIPIPGFRNVAQVQDNAGALAFGPLSKEQFDQVEELMGRTGVVAEQA